MSGEVEQLPPNGVRSTEERPQSGFTAVNGHSPTQAKHSVEVEPAGRPETEGTAKAPRPNNNTEKPMANGGQAQHKSQVVDREDSVASSKRRRSSSPESADESPSSSVSYSTSKRHMSETNGDGELKGNRSPDGYAYHTPQGSNANMDGHFSGHMNGGDSAWSQREREDSLNSETRLAEALQRESQSLGQHPANGSSIQRYAQITPQQGENGVSIQTPISATSSGAQQRQRKRIFSNRTKTGCLTCRKRKKKCDEAKPKCNNCERGGFDCLGYSKNGHHVKAGAPRAQPPPLQAKDGFYPDPGIAYPYPPPPPRHLGGPEFPPTEQYPHQMHPIEPDRHRPVAMDDQRDLRSIPHPQAPNGYPRPAWPPEDRRSSYPPPPDHMIRSDYPRPSLPEFPRDQNKRMPTPPRTLPPPHRVPSNPAHYSSSRMSQTAQLALQHPSVAQPPPPQMPVYRTEKEKMLNSVPYLHQDPQLIQDRRDCKSALHRFNRDAVDPHVSEAQVQAAFKQIVAPDHLKTGHHPIGHVGNDVEVGSAFSCEYGYNISIGDRTEVGQCCNMLDAAKITIGARVIIGPNVSFYTKDGDHKTPRAAGEMRKMVARPIIIEDDAFIGGNVTIMPGVKIGRNATIGAHSVIERDVKAQLQAFTERKTRIPQGHWAQPLA